MGSVAGIYGKFGDNKMEEDRARDDNTGKGYGFLVEGADIDV
jgi:hypothetical protein